MGQLLLYSVLKAASCWSQKNSNCTSTFPTAREIWKVGLVALSVPKEQARVTDNAAEQEELPI